jgi:probable F420-dependent oxidoreductase
MKLDAAIPPTSGIDQRRTARALEDAGFDGLWVGEITHDPLLMLTLAATATHRVRLGTSVALAFARNPMSLALAAYDLQAITEGRLHLGIGSQVKAHIVRRFSMPWASPAARMREFVQAMRAIWACWAAGGASGSTLDFHGDFYDYSLMPAFFVPQPNGFGTPPVLLAAVGSAMTEVAGEVADGVVLHSFTTPRYLTDVTIPALQRGRPTLDGFDIVGHPMIITGRTERELETAKSVVRAQLAFYASTPAYRGVLDLHGWRALGEELHSLSRQGRWSEMTDLVDDTVLSEFSLIGEPAAVGRELVRQYGSVFTRCVLGTPYETDRDVLSAIADAARGTAGEGATR